jgi:hypothetical protein
MPKGPIRRAQLIAPFGVAALWVAEDGTSLITGGLDHWFEAEYGGLEDHGVNVDEFIVREWRLERLLHVDHFRLPPDYRRTRPGAAVPNCRLTVPFLRFPRWHFCPRCRRLREYPLVTRGRIRCPECEAKGKKVYMAQVPFVAMCDHGHIQDLPWREWVHHRADPSCSGHLSLWATGGATLASQIVECECGQKRNLSGVTEAASDGSSTHLSSGLDHPTRPFLCQGGLPWLGREDGEGCGRPLRGSLRSASNVYFADVRSAIYLPSDDADAPAELVELLSLPPLAQLLELISGLGGNAQPQHLRSQHPDLLQAFSDGQIIAATRLVLSRRDGVPEARAAPVAGPDLEHLRRVEYECLATPREDEQLMIEAADVADYAPDVAQYFSGIMLVKKLRETRVFAGFSRVFPDNGLDLEVRKSMLRRTRPSQREAWLPAYKVHGEGVFLLLQEARLRQWESDERVQARIRPLVARYRGAQQRRHLRERPLGPRLVLLHTVSHILMNQLTFECGYSTAALRERLYVAEDEAAPMAGLLIYTAAGDAEGTLGGLVGMGRSGRLEPVLRRALDRARWCSADPVCMEVGASGGQGPDSCNLAACHNCALVPETACEEFNRFLDRAVVVGTADEPIGFFG